MIKDEIKSIKSEKSDIRKFGLSVGIVLGLLGGFLWWRGKESYDYFLFVSFALIFFGLFIPSVLKPLQKGWMIFAVIIGWFMTRVILTVLFYLVITPLSIILRLVGKDFLDKKFNRKSDSYWIKREKTSFNKNDYERQF